MDDFLAQRSAASFKPVLELLVRETGEEIKELKPGAAKPPLDPLPLVSAKRGTIRLKENLRIVRGLDRRFHLGDDRDLELLSGRFARLFQPGEEVADR